MVENSKLHIHLSASGSQVPTHKPFTGTTFPPQRDADIEGDHLSTSPLMLGHLHDTFDDWVVTSGVDNIGDLVLRKGRGAAVKAMFDNKTKAECLGSLGSESSA